MFKKIQRYVPFCVALLFWQLAGVESVAKITRRMPQILTQIVAPATPDNPRHSEGSMVRLKDGRILLDTRSTTEANPKIIHRQRSWNLYVRSWADLVTHIHVAGKHRARKCDVGDIPGLRSGRNRVLLSS